MLKGINERAVKRWNSTHSIHLLFETKWFTRDSFPQDQGSSLCSYTRKRNSRSSLRSGKSWLLHRRRRQSESSIGENPLRIYSKEEFQRFRKQITQDFCGFQVANERATPPTAPARKSRMERQENGVPRGPTTGPPNRPPPRVPSALSYDHGGDTGSDIYVTSAAYKAPSEIRWTFKIFNLLRIIIEKKPHRSF